MGSPHQDTATNPVSHHQEPTLLHSPRERSFYADTEQKVFGQEAFSAASETKWTDGGSGRIDTRAPVHFPDFTDEFCRTSLSNSPDH